MSEARDGVVAADGRLDAGVRQALEMSASAARRAIRSGKIFVDGARDLDPGTPVRAGQTLRFDPAAPRPGRTEPFGARLVHRDHHIIVLDKPAGLLSAPVNNRVGPTALDAALNLCRGHRGAKIVHRLDMDTSGLMVFARSVRVARAMQDIIAERRLERTYQAIVRGAPRRDEGTIVSMLLGDRGDGYRGSRAGTLHVLPLGAPIPEPEGVGRIAVTHYRVVAHEGEHSALELRLDTGRTHQIRVHLSELGCPILGEHVYARDLGSPRQALHAARLALPHPATGKPLRFESPWPDDLDHLRPRVFSAQQR